MAKIIEMAGIRVGRLLVLRLGGQNNSGNYYWVCRCDCGIETEVRGQLLRGHITQSCGCLAVEKSKSRITHGQSRSGGHSPEYRSWQAMKKRCNDPNYPQFHLYGGRGIKVCERWTSFSNFYDDMGPQPSPEHSSLDRYPDNDGNYEPGNCRWATLEEQGRNKRNNRIVVYRGREMALAEAADMAGLPYDTVLNRVARLGWSDEDALKQEHS